MKGGIYHFFGNLLLWVVALFFILLGLGTVAIPWIRSVEKLFLRLISREHLLLFILGISAILIGSALIVHLILHSRRRRYLVVRGPHSFEVHAPYFLECLNVYWNEIFPEYEIVSTVTLSSNRLYIEASLPHVPENEEKPLLEKIQGDLQVLFLKKAGFNGDIFLTIDFN